MEPSLEDVARFWAKVDKNPSDPVAKEKGCWLWSAGLFSNGYGQYWIMGKAVGAHRMAFSLASGMEISVGKHIMHSCDNRPCCNPAHLQEGTHADNMRDMVAKGREVDNKGSRHGMSKLTEDQVGSIKSLIQAGLSDPTIAPEFGVARECINKIRRGVRWAHVA